MSSLRRNQGTAPVSRPDRTVGSDAIFNLLSDLESLTAGRSHAEKNVIRLSTYVGLYGSSVHSDAAGFLGRFCRLRIFGIDRFRRQRFGPRSSRMPDRFRTIGCALPPDRAHTQAHGNSGQKLAQSNQNVDQSEKLQRRRPLRFYRVVDSFKRVFVAYSPS